MSILIFCDLSTLSYRTTVLNRDALKRVCLAKVMSNKHFGILTLFQIVVIRRSIFFVVFIRERRSFTEEGLLLHELHLGDCKGYRE